MVLKKPVLPTDPYLIMTPLGQHSSVHCSHFADQKVTYQFTTMKKTSKLPDKFKAKTCFLIAIRRYASQKALH